MESSLYVVIFLLLCHCISVVCQDLFLYCITFVVVYGDARKRQEICIFCFFFWFLLCTAIDYNLINARVYLLVFTYSSMHMCVCMFFSKLGSGRACLSGIIYDICLYDQAHTCVTKYFLC
jgi:hypothetical protein